MKAESSGTVISVDVWVVNTSKEEETFKPEYNAKLAGTNFDLEKPRNKYGKIRKRWLPVRAFGSSPWLNPEGHLLEFNTSKHHSGL